MGLPADATIIAAQLGAVAVVLAAVIGLAAVVIGARQQQVGDQAKARRERVSTALRDLIRICRDMKDTATKLTVTVEVSESGVDEREAVSAVGNAIRDYERRLREIVEPEVKQVQIQLVEVFSQMETWGTNAHLVVALNLARDRRPPPESTPSPTTEVELGVREMEMRAREEVQQIEKALPARLGRLERELEARLKRVQA